MNKKNQILILESIQKVVESFDGDVYHSLNEDNPRTFFGKKLTNNRSVLELRLEESTPGEVKKSTGRPAGSVKTI